MPLKSQSNGMSEDLAASSAAKDSPDPGVTQPPSHASSPGAASQAPTAHDASKDLDALSGPSPYGTRSRNRGQARPNYAEDSMDIDMYDAVSDKKDDDSKKTSRQVSSSASAVPDAPRPTATSTRKSLLGDDKANGSQTPSVNGSSTPSNVATPAASGNVKKRKAAQSNGNTAQASAQGAPNATGGSASSRRGGAQSSVPAKPTGGYRESNMLTFDDCGGKTKHGVLVADDGTSIAQNDHVYLVCEPPGEPYYLGRIMEFLHAQNDRTKPVEALRINWFYRPKDIGKKVNDTRLLFASMHSDVSPLTSLRGKCQVRHKAEIANLDEYRQTPDCFWFEKLYDRYIQKHYEVVPTFQIVNVPERVKKVLDERWKYILVEQGKSKEFTSAAKLCKKCGGYCARDNSVDCANCNKTYHMQCVSPPLLKKPSRGFAWSCAACARAQERKLEARHTNGSHPDVEEEEPVDEEDDGAATGRTTPGDAEDLHPAATPEQVYQASLWQYRYLGTHCKPEDALDYDDRIYPRAGSRLGPKHQAYVPVWPGRPVQLVRPPDNRRGGNKNKHIAKDLVPSLEDLNFSRDNRPKWVQDAPAGYVARGEDLPNDYPNNTAKLLWKPPSEVDSMIEDEAIDKFMSDAQSKIPALGLPERSTNLMDVARDLLFENDFDTAAALRKLPKVDRADFREPDLSSNELKKFEEAVGKFGSELLSITRATKPVKYGRIVRFYYVWKKSERGKQIWGNYPGRKGKKEAKKAAVTAENKLQDDVADDRDDSAFDTDKAVKHSRNFMCRFCNTKSSRQWRRAPNTGSAVIIENGTKSKDKGMQYIAALCRRCAELWRRYAIQWEDIDDLSKRVAAAGPKSFKRKIDEDLLKELLSGEELMNLTVYDSTTAVPAQTRSAPSSVATNGTEAPPRKKLKTTIERDPSEKRDSEPSTGPQRKKDKAVEKPAPPPAPVVPKARILPCAVCGELDGPEDANYLSCKECRLTVHRRCYGVTENRVSTKWTCDMCINDKNPQVAIHYKCVLCPVDDTDYDAVHGSKLTGKKKSEKEKDKDRSEREAAQKAVDYWRQKQQDMGRPIKPREPLKRTADNNWVHVTCATFTPEVKFGNARALGPSEGIPSIPRAKYEEICKICKCKDGACVACHQCRAPVHVECAHQDGYLLGFEVTPVKGSRRDQHNIVTINGETGFMSAAIWCKEHFPVKTVVHSMHEIVAQPESEGPEPALPLNALQLYVHNYKQADLTLTGTVRKANLITQALKNPATAPVANTSRRQSTTVASSQRASSTDHQVDSATSVSQEGEKVCITCGIDVSLKWWPIGKDQEKALVNGHMDTLGSEAQKFVAQRGYRCHKCKKTNRQPAPHVPPSQPAALPAPMDVEPLIEPTRATSALHTALASPPAHVTHAVNRMSDLGSPWANRPPAVQAPAAHVPLPPVAAPPIHMPTGGPPSTMPLAMPHPGPSPMIPPAMPSAPHHQYGPPSTAYGDWHRSPPAPQMNGPPLSGSMQHNHLRDLRPPPIAPMSHHPGSSLHGQPLLNGIPHSPPRRAPQPPLPGGPSYMSPYHHHTPSSMHSLTSGGPPPPLRPSDHSFSQGLLPQRASFTTPHASPPLSRDPRPLSRDPNHSNSSVPRPNDGRPASGASASPSLRNLLS
ncbi:uncharacterized protein B0I36DRAFT_87152 [Microdochium trichocladiopsis]|uniref:Uncharacterized protein n=1 Tax=Microdochium trichocladiopsis TaxID=1682393 RepID=A0A9P8YDQ9_9PEZI|nr:uncharacterized protein B0I36DRAFT_87152 [Microdochium trichocladiopsis]KAH7035037.1 hypothetical protein B0I36DRAFT_87152 [Microdochium trichocladiopsis]